MAKDIKRNNGLKQLHWLQILTAVATLLCLVVINVGAFTRLSNAGLGCPDWPGCYGKMVVPKSPEARAQMVKAYPNAPLQVTKAKTEMWHRYLAGVLGCVIVVISVLAVMTAVRFGLLYLLSGIGLLGLLGVQVVLGMWTVTLQLYPMIVTLHLLCALCLLSLLWLLFLRSNQLYRSGSLKMALGGRSKGLKLLAAVTLVVLFLQIALGGWTSTHYAGVVCKGFPMCHPDGALAYDFKAAFNWLVPMGVNYEGGLLSEGAKMTIQVVHRFGALCVAVLMMLLSLFVFLRFKKITILRRIIYFLGLFFIAQVALGAVSAIYQLPMSAALLHNLVAALLLLGIVSFNFFLYEVFLDESNSKKWIR